MNPRVKANKKYTNRLKKEGWKACNFLVPNGEIKQMTLDYKNKLVRQWRKENKL